MHSAASPPPPLINSVFPPKRNNRARTDSHIWEQSGQHQSEAAGAENYGTGGDQAAAKWRGRRCRPSGIMDDGHGWGESVRNMEMAKKPKKAGNLILKPKFWRITSSKAPIRIIYSWSEYGWTNGHPLRRKRPSLWAACRGNFPRNESLFSSLKDEQRHIVTSSVSHQSETSRC